MDKALETTGRLKEIEIEVRFLGEQTARNFIEMGRLLSEAKEKFYKTNDSGFWNWVDKNFGFFIKKRSASKYIRLYQKFGGHHDALPLKDNEKLDILASLEDEQVEEVLTQDHLIKGEIKKATDLSRDELRQVVNEKKEVEALLESTSQELNLERLNAEEKIQKEIERRMAEARLEMLQEKESLRAKAVEVNKKLEEVQEQKLASENWLKNRERDINVEEKRIKEEKVKHLNELERLKRSEEHFKNQISEYQNEIDKLIEEKNSVIIANKKLTDSSKRYKDIIDFIDEMAKFDVMLNKIFSNYYSEELTLPEIKEKVLAQLKILNNSCGSKIVKISNEEYREVING